jgi:peptidoglycan/xylan/chitin deacetylase (PgdA/CDA1 family)
MMPLTVVMYHHVRSRSLRRFAEIPALESTRFREQLNYLAKNYRFVSIPECLAALQGGEPLPDAACLLTFDDGYAEHFTSVFPLLEERKIPAAFFPPARAVLRRELLDVHKIHFIFARAKSLAQLEAAVSSLSRQMGAEIGTAEGVHPNVRFDVGDRARLKQFLQRALPAALRAEIVDALFREVVAEDPSILADELYLTIDELRLMSRHGMYVGGHGWDHPWWDLLSDADQDQEISGTLEFLSLLGRRNDAWAFAYPYGSFTNTSALLLSRAGCGLAFTTEPVVAHLNPTSALKLPRLDTNDIPSPRA